MANIMFTSQYEGRFDVLGMLQLYFYIYKKTYGRSDRIANIKPPSHYT